MQIKILDLNIWNGGILKDNIANFVKELNPDIVCYQEVRDSLKDPKKYDYSVFGEKLGFEHTYFAPAFYATEEDEKFASGNMIASKFLITNKESEFYFGELDEIRITKWRDGDNYGILPRLLQKATIDVNGIKLNVFNTQGVWGKDGEDNPERLKMGEFIAQKVWGQEKTVLMGDFNVQPRTQTIGKIEKVLTNVFKGELKTSFNLKHKTNPGFATAVADMFFASSDIKVIKHECLEVDVSDHLPLVVELQINS